MDGHVTYPNNVLDLRGLEICHDQLNPVLEVKLIEKHIQDWLENIVGGSLLLDPE